MKLAFLAAFTLISGSVAEPLPAEKPSLSEFIKEQQLTLPALFRFEQTRTIQGLPRPLISKGTLNISEDNIEWRTTHPVQQLLVVSAEGIVDKHSDTNFRGSEIIARLLMAVLSGDVKKIERNFYYAIRQPCIELKPRNESVARFIQSIESCGSPKLDTIRLKEPAGNSSVIQLYYSDEASS
ncbi:hypothetical protein IDSA_07160 [Pseudidiomarina salinarum]|uniref:LolA family outer membrane lipoprotein-sorting protein n=1 Tax=Pseudidiomarina salinarum TaxID=435908 RepID=A0A094IUS3_9GAMM|nr:outer membrane lipoprotein carrier protein LolA [Pseudidiomarina salinarum]KFZ30852.1 hypothetical protein IDSA_07160 [Pseudidiomarina salinarum]RUO71326.1 outer membrane lipoprotein carrier protein LolA [Pseudidiomarina salinarum]